MLDCTITACPSPPTSLLRLFPRRGADKRGAARHGYRPTFVFKTEENFTQDDGWLKLLDFSKPFFWLLGVERTEKPCRQYQIQHENRGPENGEHHNLTTRPAALQII